MTRARARAFEGGAGFWRARTTPRVKTPQETAATQAEDAPKRAGSTYRPWAELLARTFAVDVLECPTCKGRMKLIALVKNPENILVF